MVIPKCSGSRLKTVGLTTPDKEHYEVSGIPRKLT